MWMEGEETYQRTKQVVKRKETSSVNISKAGFLNIDLVGPMHREHGYQYMLTCLDLGTRRFFYEPIKNKIPSQARDAFKKIILDNDLKVSVVKSDNGSEFRSDFLTYLDENQIKHFNSAPGQPWTNPCERYHRTCKQALHKYEVATGKKNWIEPMKKIVDNMNKSYNISLRTTPNESTDLPDEVRLERLQHYGKKKRRNNGKSAFQIGDICRKRINKSGKFEKQKEFFSEKTYIISKVIRGDDSRLVTYKLTEDGVNNIVGTFNISDLILVNQNEAPHRELLVSEDIQIGERTKQDQREIDELNSHTENVSEIRDSRNPDPDSEGFFRVEKILSRRKFGKVWKYKIKWLGYDESFDTWEPAKNLYGAKELLAEFNQNLKKR